MEKRLQRDENSKMIGGVAAGLAEYFDVDVTWVRLGFILAVVAGFSGILAYIILWVAVPAKPFNPYGPVKTDYKVYEDKSQSQPFASQAPGFTPYQAPLKTNKKDNGSLIAGAVLIFIGLYFLTDQFDFLPYWFSFHKLWPLALIIPGILILTKAGNNRPAYTAPAEPVQEKTEPATETTNPNSESTIN